jgi:hypothetical protein
LHDLHVASVVSLQRETRELVIQRLEQERAESEAANAGPVGVDDINTDDEVPLPACIAFAQRHVAAAAQRAGP